MAKGLHARSQRRKRLHLQLLIGFVYALSAGWSPRALPCTRPHPRELAQRTRSFLESRSAFTIVSRIFQSSGVSSQGRGLRCASMPLIAFFGHISLLNVATGLHNRVHWEKIASGLLILSIFPNK